MSMPSVSSRPGRVREFRQANALEGLEDRRLMSVVTPSTPNSAARIETSLGRITFLLNQGYTPQTVKNFLNNYVYKGLYDNTVVHRSVPGFIIQMGGFKANPSQGYPKVDAAGPVVNEFFGATGAQQQAIDTTGSNKVNVRGTVAMAKVPPPPNSPPTDASINSATNEFFINLADNSSNLDNQNGGFTTFARVIGGGMHVADAIAGLNVIDGTNLNSAFTDLPVIPSRFSNNPVVLSSVKAQSTLRVRLGGNDKTKFVTWVDENGGTATISLTGGGTGDLLFVGGNDMRPVERGNRITITGKGVSLDEIATKKTSARSVLAIKSVGGKGPAHIGDIVVNGQKSLGRIDAPTVQVRGDITANHATIGSINLQGTYRSTIHTNGGKLSLHIGTAVDTSVNTSGPNSDTNAKGTIKSLVAQTWVDDGQLDTSIVTGRLNFMEVNGNFSSDITTSGDVGVLKINGNVGTKGTSKWTIAGNAKNIQVGKIIGLKAIVTKRLDNLHAREVVAADDGTTTLVSAKSIGRVTLATLTNQSTISASANIKSVTVTGLMDSSTIRAGKNIRSVTIGTVSGNTVNSTQTALIPSGIYAGVVENEPDPLLPSQKIPVTFVTKTSQFSNRDATIGRVTVRQKFSNTNIAAATIGILKLGTVQAANLEAFGVTADKHIGAVVATVKNKPVAMPAAESDAAVKSYFKRIGLELFPLNQQGNGNRFNVGIV